MAPHRVLSNERCTAGHATRGVHAARRRFTQGVIRIAAIAAALLPASPSLAEFSIAAGFMHFDRAETDTTGITLNTETGFIPGITGRYTLRTDTLAHELSLQHWRGDVDYDGSTQGGTPVVSRTDQAITVLGYQLSLATMVDALSVYIGGAWHEWDRDIRGTAVSNRLHETYNWVSLEAGVSLGVDLSARDSLELLAGLVLEGFGNLQIDLTSANLGKPELELGDGRGIRLQATYVLALQQQSELRVRLEYSVLEMDRGRPELLSDGTTLVTLVEPESRSTPVTAVLEYRSAF